MSIAVLIGVHDGLVLASDSASTVLATTQPGTVLAAHVYDNANKIFNLIKGQPLGCITFGSGSIGKASIGTLIKDFRKELSEKKVEKNKYKFNVRGYRVEEVVRLLAAFLNDECKKSPPAERVNINTGFLIGGYSGEGSLGESWALHINQGVAGVPLKLREPDQPGVCWGGQGEAIQRIALGYSPEIFEILARVMQPPQTAEQVQQGLQAVLNAHLQVPLVSAPMPIQDAIDLGRFLVHSAIMFSHFRPGAPIVGGPIEIAAITKHEGFKWISRKHYYDQSLNREPIHVATDD